VPDESVHVATERAASRASERIQSLEVLRVLAIFGIVWFHSEGVPGRQFGYAGLPVFIMLSISLTVLSARRHPFGEFARRRAERLLVPWLFWSGVYLLPAVVRAWQRGIVGDLLSISTVVGGTWIHLWFLPFAFAASLLVYPFHGKVHALRPGQVLALAATAACLAIVGSSFALAAGVGVWPVPQWVFSSPAVVLGFALGIGLAERKRSGQADPKAILLITLFAVGTCAALAALGRRELTVPYSVGLVLLAAALFVDVPRSRVAQYVAPLTFGIYLIHPAVGMVLRRLPGASSMPTFGLLFLVFCISAALVAVVRATTLKRFV